MRRLWKPVVWLTVGLLVFGLALPVMAQTEDTPDLVLFTDYPSRVIGFEESPTIRLTLRTGTKAQIVQLEMEEMPDGWTATFRGGGSIIKSVYVEPDKDASVSLRLEPPADVAGGTHKFVVVAKGERTTARLPLELTVQERIPPRLSLKSDLPTVRGKPTSTFRYSATLRNEGDEDLTVSLLADAPTGFIVTIKTGGKEVTSLPLEANSSKTLSIEAKPFLDVAAGDYPFTIRAEGGSAQAELELVAQVSGEARLTISAPDGRLSGEAYAGKDTPLKIVIRNTGSAPARGIELSSSAPAGWNVTFDPDQIAEIAAGDEAEVTVHVQPADNALTGDYMVTIRARPEGTATQSADFRITVLTSTLWGIVGVALIAIAVGVVALAVLRFGRR